MVVHGRPKTPKKYKFLGSPSPQGSQSPYILGDTTRPGHVTCVLVWSKSDRRRLRKTLHKQRDRQTNRHYESNGHLAVNQYNSQWQVSAITDSPRDALHHGKYVANKSGCSVWWTYTMVELSLQHATVELSTVMAKREKATKFHVWGKVPEDIPSLFFVDIRISL